jgi:hypothetical protein
MFGICKDMEGNIEYTGPGPSSPRLNRESSDLFIDENGDIHSVVKPRTTNN